MNTTVEWLPGTLRPSGMAAHAEAKYRGAVAEGYDAKREDSPKWKIEQRLVEAMLDDMPDESVVLDCPVGTGRFLSYYKRRGFYVWAMDINPDMLKEAEAKEHGEAIFGEADVRDTKMPDRSVDVSVMVRMTRWLEPDDVVKALRELQRVTRKRIIFTARVRNHPHARSYELINSALDGWQIARDEAGVDLDYRVIALEPKR